MALRPIERGIQPGDKILQIDGKSTAGMTIDEALKRMRGPAGSNVVLTVLREGMLKPKDYSIGRELIRVQPMRMAYLDKGFPYVENSDLLGRT